METQTRPPVERWIENAVERGATRVEEIHKAIAELPLGVMERTGFFERTAAEIRQVQDQSISAVYDVVREVNHRIGELASDLRRGPGPETRRPER